MEDRKKSSIDMRSILENQAQPKNRDILPRPKDNVHERYKRKLWVEVFVTALKSEYSQEACKERADNAVERYEKSFFCDE